MNLLARFRLLGPGILFAAAAIGVSHLVQATKAGAEYGLGLLWAVIIVHIVKYPFFKFGPLYAAATGESLLEGFGRLGKGVLYGYFLISLMTMFTIQAAVGLVTAGLAQYFFGWSEDIFTWMFIVMTISIIILAIGKYKMLDLLMKGIVILLTLSTIVAVVISYKNSTSGLDFQQIIPSETAGILFLLALMGWMPAPLDVIVWQSIWTIEKQKTNKDYTSNNALRDFNIGYGFTILLAICFLLLGTFVMFGTGTVFSGSAIKFSHQLVHLYSSQLGSIASVFISIAVLTTMFSTSLTTLDASSRTMSKTLTLLLPDQSRRNIYQKNSYWVWLSILFVGTLIIIKFFISEMGLMIKIATVFSFLTAPLYAIIVLVLIRSKFTPEAVRPSKIMTFYSIVSILLLFAFSAYYLYSL